MNARHVRTQAPMLSLGDIYYIIFRHKWKILGISAFGLLLGLAAPLVFPPEYESEAKLLIKYVLDSRVPSQPGGNEPRVTMPDAAGRNIINTELQILTSIDLAEEVATNVGPEKIVGKNGNPVSAALRIKNNLMFEVPNNSDVIRLVYRHSDPAVVQEVLAQVVNVYKQRHAEIHRPGGDDEVLTQEADGLRSRLKRTEDELQMQKTNLNIVSLDEARSFFSEESKELKKDLDDARADLAEHQAAVDVLSERVKLSQPVTNSVQTAQNTNSVPPVKMAEYKRISDVLDAFRQKERDLRLVYLPGSPHLKPIEDQIASAESEKTKLLAENPGLIAVKTSEPQATQPASNLEERLITETSTVAGLQRKINVLTNELDNVQQRSSAVEAGANAINELERTRKLEEEHLTYYSESLEDARVDEALGPGKGSNIEEIETPEAAILDNSKMKKARLGLCVGGILAGLGLAFLIELYFDRTVRRPVEVESRLGVPLFLSIPYRNGNGHSRLLKAPPETALVIKSGLLNRSVPLTARKTTIGRAEDNSIVLKEGSVSAHHCEIVVRQGVVMVRDLGSQNGTFVDGARITEAPLTAGQALNVGQAELEVATQQDEQAQELAVDTVKWTPRPALRPFYDALRDRLITYFEMKNLTHKPKLVAVTSCGEGAGVSSIAAGLAAALSETDEGNVLLVDMNDQDAAAAYFHKGRLASGLDEALSKDRRHEALVQNHLYVVTEGSNDDSVVPLLPKRFSNLVPKLKSSDYDYIIFDMPPVSQISITPRLARFMDMALVVVESEKNDRDVVQRAVSMLSESTANVGVVLNKRKKYVPKQLLQEL